MAVKDDDELSRRELLLGAGVLGGGVALGFSLREDEQTPVMPGGGGPVGEPLLIKQNAVHSLQASNWYSEIVWESSGELIIEDGAAVGVLN